MRNPVLRLAALPSLVALACAAFASPAMPAPGLWKCAGGSGPVYQDRPCTPGTELRDLAADPPPLSVVPFVSPPASPSPRSTRRVDRPAAAKTRARDATPARGDAAERRFLREGMSEGEVLARLGAPDLGSGKGGRKARWSFLPAPGDPQTMTVVRFEDGRVIAVDRITVR